MKYWTWLLTVTLALFVGTSLTPLACAQKMMDEGEREERMRFQQQQQRAERWALVLPKDNPELLRKKLASLQAKVLLEESVATFRLHEDLTNQPGKVTVMSREDYLTLYSRHIFCFTENGAWRDAFAKALGLKQVPMAVGVGLARDLEEVMLREELARSKQPEPELVKQDILTAFEIDRQDGSWQVRIIAQGTRNEIMGRPRPDWLCGERPVTKHSHDFKRSGNIATGPANTRLIGTRHLRQARWVIILPRENAETFRKKLAEIKAILLFPDGESVSSFNVCEDLSKNPPEIKKISQQGVSKYNRLWYMSHDKTDCEHIGTALKLEKPPRWIAIFIPHDLEKALSEAEFNHQKLSENELNERKWITRFEVDRKEDLWLIKVRSQGPRQERPDPIPDDPAGPKGGGKSDPGLSDADPDGLKQITGERKLRKERWVLLLPREDPEVFVKKIVQFRAAIVIPDPKNQNSYQVCENLAQRPIEWKSVNQETLRKDDRLWFLSRSKTDCEYVAVGLYLTKQPPWIAILIPEDLEKVLTEAELKFKNLSEKELNDKKWITIFDVDRRGDAWDVRVRYQGPRKK
jgi:hypothetical protein